MTFWRPIRASLLAMCCLVFFLHSEVHALLSLNSSFTVAQSYTDNLFYEDTNRKSDIGTFLGPNFTLQYDNPDIVIGATYFGRFALFIKNPDANQYIQNANIILDLPFLTKRYRGLTVTIDEGMNFTPQLDAFSLSGAEDGTLPSQGFQSFGGAGAGAGGAGGAGGSAVGGSAGGGSTPFGPQGGLGATGTSGVFTSRASAFLNRAGITLGYAWTPRVQTSLGYTNQYLHFFTSGFQDSLRHGANSSLSYMVTDQTTVTPFYSYNITNFIGNSTQSTSGDKIISHYPGLQIYQILTPSLTGSISGGVTFSKQKGAKETEGGMTEQITNKWRKNFTGSASLSKTYRQGSVNLDFSQNIGYGGGLASQSTRTRTVTGRIDHALSQRMNAFASLGWATNDSVDGDAFDTNTYRIQGGLGYAFTAWLFGNLSYSHIDQRSDGSAADDLKVDQFFLGLTAVADPWFIYR